MGKFWNLEEELIDWDNIIEFEGSDGGGLYWFTSSIKPSNDLIEVWEQSLSTLTIESDNYRISCCYDHIHKCVSVDLCISISLEKYDVDYIIEDLKTTENKIKELQKTIENK